MCMVLAPVPGGGWSSDHEVRERAKTTRVADDEPGDSYSSEKPVG